MAPSLAQKTEWYAAKGVSPQSGGVIGSPGFDAHKWIAEANAGKGLAPIGINGLLGSNLTPRGVGGTAVYTSASSIR